jgi:hypothetical protein
MSFRFPALLSLFCAAASAQQEPRIDAIFPAGGKAGTTFEAVIRGTNLKGARELWFPGGQSKGRVLGIETEKVARRPADLVRVEITLHAPLTGDAQFRLIAGGGLSNPLPLFLHEEPALMESGNPHDLPAQAQRLDALPAAVHGRIREVGEVDYYSFPVKAGEVWWFHTRSSEALDPAIGIYKVTGSWFDPSRARRLAFNDEPVPYPDLPIDPVVRYKFTEAGEYLVRVNGFWGYGGEGQNYLLRITRNPPEPPAPLSGWQERKWTRKLQTDRMERLQARAIKGLKQPAITVVDGSPEPQAITMPSLVVGAVDRPGDIDRVRFSVKEGDRVAFEIETPDKTLPLMNPLLRVLDKDGIEVVTNILSTVNSNGNASKQIHPKTQYSFPRGGDFTLEMRDITATYGDAAMQYRLLIRPQVPHMGEVHAAEDHINLTAGKVRKLSVVTDQEEGFDGFVIVSMEGLPAGVRALGGTEVEPDSPPSQSEGRRERFTTKKEKATLILAVDAGAEPTSQPVKAQLYAQPVVNGALGDRIHVKDILVMVIKNTTVGKETN